MRCDVIRIAPVWCGTCGPFREVHAALSERAPGVRRAPGREAGDVRVPAPFAALSASLSEFPVNSPGVLQAMSRTMSLGAQQYRCST